MKLHADQGEGQRWNISPGNLYSKVQKVTVKADGAPIAVSLTEVIPPIPAGGGHEVCAAYPDSECGADEVLGQPMFLGRDCAGAGGV